jgi:hypothetical protein
MKAHATLRAGLAAALGLAMALPTLTEARGFAGGGMRGGGGFERGGGGGFERGGGDFNRNLDVNRSANVNVNRNVNVNSSYHGGWYGDYHPVARGVAVGAGVALGAAAIGSIAYSLPGGCVMAPYGGIGYQQCAGVWYQPQYVGTQVQYVVVNPPN